MVQPSSASPAMTSSPAPSILRKGMRMLFQGDSITDGYRKRHPSDTSDEASNHVPSSFVYLIAAELGLKYPELELSITNHGNTGSTIYTLRGAWQQFEVDLKPDLISILIGVNDAWHTMATEHSVMANFTADYDGLLADTRKTLPNTTIVLYEPFILPGDFTSRQGNWTRWKSRMPLAQQAVRSLAAKYGILLIKFQHLFHEAAFMHPPTDLRLFDSVHPTFGGRRLLANEWLRRINSVT